MGFITPQRERLQSIALDELIAQDAKCRFVVDLVERLDLQSLYARYSTQGGDAFDPKTMLATWFFAYSEGVASTRKLEQRCQRDLHFIYVSGNLRPDHTSLSRFRKGHLDLMADYFVELVHMAQQQACSDFSEIAIDGTKIQAAASAKKSKDTEALARYLRAVRHRIDEYMERAQELEANDEDDDEAAAEAALEQTRHELSRLQELETRLLERQEQLEARKQTIKAEYRQGHQINLTDPEACYQTGSCRVGYNAQVGVDTKTQLIVSCDVVQDRNDKQQFIAQYQQVERNLGADPARAYDLDSGYHTLETLAYIDHHGIDAVVADPTPEHRSGNPEKGPPATVAALEAGGKRLLRSAFVYDAEADCYHCPAGEQLVFVGKRKQKRRIQRLYRASGCLVCSLKALCVKNALGLRQIYRDEQEALAEQMSRRLEQTEARARLKRRRETVEPAIGNVKSNLGFRRFSLHSLAQVRGEFTLMCIGHNLNKLYRLLGGLFYAFYRGLEKRYKTAQQAYQRTRRRYRLSFG